MVVAAIIVRADKSQRMGRDRSFGDLRLSEAGEVTLALTGDVMLGRLTNEALHRHGAAYPWGDTAELLHQADARLINLECVIAADGRPWARTPKVFHFRADPIAIATLHVADIDCVSLANNHVLDFEETALLEMLERLDGAGIAPAGAGRDIQEAFRPAALDVKGSRIAVVAITDNEPEWAATESRPGTAFLRIDPGDGVGGAGRTRTEPLSVRVRSSGLEQAIEEVRSRADLVICSAHWGPNMRRRPSQAFRDFAHRLLDSGVDVFYGHSAHVFQGIELYRRKLLLYDTGDFVDDYAVDDQLRNDRSFLFLLRIREGRVAALELIPVLIARCQVNRSTGKEFAETCATMRELSSEFGTNLEDCPAGLCLRVQ
jgi:poly-gamma-glutamate synthesis protein (capsule biosynthesis protein)